MTWLASFRSAHRSAVLAALVIGGLLALVVVLVWPITDLIAAHDVGNIAGHSRPLHLQDAREAVRSQLLTLAAGIFVAGTLWFTAQSYRLARLGQVTDRYAKAVEQLGSDKLDVRIGSIYALERIARDSPPDHSVVMEVLAAFIREHSHEPWPPDSANAADPRVAGRRTRPDVEAAMTVIGRRRASNDRLPIDVSRAELIWAYLPGANLERLDLYRADLTRAILRDARLANASLVHARLADADLTGADLTDAKIDGVDFADADLTNVRLGPRVTAPLGWAEDHDTGLLRRAPQP